MTGLQWAMKYQFYGLIDQMSKDQLMSELNENYIPLS
jgi:hypothetical protein